MLQASNFQTQHRTKTVALRILQRTDMISVTFEPVIISLPADCFWFAISLTSCPKKICRRHRVGNFEASHVLLLLQVFSSIIMHLHLCFWTCIGLIAGTAHAKHQALFLRVPSFVALFALDNGYPMNCGNTWEGWNCIFLGMYILTFFARSISITSDNRSKGNWRRCVNLQVSLSSGHRMIVYQ